MADKPIITYSDKIAEAARDHAERILRAQGTSLRNYMPNSQRDILSAVMDCYEQAYREGTRRVAMHIRETAQNMRRAPFESATMAEAAVLGARELQDIADAIDGGQQEQSND